MVDLDKRDIELEIWVDQEYSVSRDAELNSNVDCREDVAKCLDLNFSAAFVVVPPGQHTVRAEIRKRECGSISSSNPLMSYQVMYLKRLFGGRNVREESCGWCSSAARLYNTGPFFHFYASSNKCKLSLAKLDKL